VLQERSWWRIALKLIQADGPLVETVAVKRGSTQ
jgi:hypothetical protein